ncbi:tRNA-queuosine alpha-mannosyltransferase domain-containing protein [Parathalassolituus penaei]|uniref:tRNA-queuosine alpha-mannosyltransferase n=1 Tax=Parathalassolituus penaei TaxID=2997323 RepID=A0A9X3EFU9_9GAMM|nr:DUF3524 domain-containing protein [Parathalassolituus penaei]MCY0966797.1 DUF3524 domain-containing protein [Parathalassolituus penaei]
MSAPRILLLSAYRSDSHASWVDWLVQHLQADWRVLELPGRFFRWRIRGNPLSWLPELEALLANWQPERILATSMVDIATIKGLCPSLAAVPVSYYFHENQYAYPVTASQHSSVDPLMVQLYGALAADELLFNSLYNRDSYLDGVEQLLKRLPDAVPPGIRERLAGKCQWMPVVVNPVAASAAVERDPRLILWNHRWEYDKQPEAFIALLDALTAAGEEFRLALLGGRAPKTPPALKAIRERYADRILVDGRVSRAEYQQWLQRATVVVSTAIHEFQGLSMLEATSAGAIPLVPDRLCYVEQYPSVYRYPCCANVNVDAKSAAVSSESAAEREGRELVSLVQAAFAGQLPPCDVSNWLAGNSVTLWQQWLQTVSATRDRVLS